MENHLRLARGKLSVRSACVPSSSSVPELPPTCASPMWRRASPDRARSESRSRACGVCFHDVVVRNGTFRRGVEMPVILGHEVAGTVERLGAEVRGFRVGDLVATTIHSHVCGECHNCRGGHETSCPERIFLGDAGLNGGYAELVCVDADAALKVPSGYLAGGGRHRRLHNRHRTQCGARRRPRAARRTRTGHRRRRGAWAPRRPAVAAGGRVYDRGDDDGSQGGADPRGRRGRGHRGRARRGFFPAGSAPDGWAVGSMP